MTMNTNNISIWLKGFQYSWLPEHILNNARLIKSITTKLHELEQLLIQNNQSEDQCAKSSDTEQRPLITTSDIQNSEDDENKKRQVSYRPAIRLKRIPLSEAQSFLPAGWKPPKQKRNQKKNKKRSPKSVYSTKKRNRKNTQANKTLSSSSASSIQLETSTVSNGIRKSTRSRKPTRIVSSTSLTSIQSTNDNQKKYKRKLRAMDGEDDDLYILGNLSQIENANGNGDIECEQVSRYIGQNGILSQTKRTNETMMTTFDDDFTIKLTSRQINQEKLNNLSNYSNDLNINSLVTTEAIPIDDDITLPSDEQLFPDGLDNESLFTSLDKQFETNSILNNHSLLNYDDCIEDITNDGIDPPPPPPPSSSTTTATSNLDHHLSLIT